MEASTTAAWILGDYMAHPKIFGGSDLAETWASVQPLPRGNPDLFDAWTCLFKAHGRAKLAYEALKTRPKIFICDYPSYGLSGKETISDSRQCGGCSSVVYCSKDCQRQDWAEQHSNECAQARDFHRERRGTDTWYEHELRASHAALLEVVYAEKRHLGYDARDTLPVFNFTPVDALEKRSRAETYPDQEQCWNGSFGQTYLKDRLWTVVTTFRSGSVPAGWRLVQGIFPPLGKDQSIELLVLLKPVGAGYRTAYCMARYRSKGSPDTR